MSGIVIIRSNEDAAAFRRNHPEGYTIMDGDKGVGLLGEYAATAASIGSDPKAWIKFASVIGPAIHASRQ